MWKAVFVVAGAAVGYVGPIVVGAALSFAADLAASWPGRSGAVGGHSELADWIRWIGVPLGVLVFSLFGFCLGARWDRRAGSDEAPQKWKATMAALGAAIGPVVGFFAVYCISLVSTTGDCWRKFGAFFAGLLHGAPIGGIVFCLLGLCLGEAMDARSRHNNLHIEDSDSA